MGSWHVVGMDPNTRNEESNIKWKTIRIINVKGKKTFLINKNRKKTGIEKLFC